jgi:hypothetical protein
MHANAVSLAPMPWCRHVDRPVRPLEEAPAGARERVAEHRALAACEHSGEVLTRLREVRMADGVYAAVHAVQPTGSNSGEDGVFSKPEVTELRDADDAVIARREPRHQRIHPSFRTLFA